MKGVLEITSYLIFLDSSYWVHMSSVELETFKTADEIMFANGDGLSVIMNGLQIVDLAMPQLNGN